MTAFYVVSRIYTGTLSESSCLLSFSKNK